MNQDSNYSFVTVHIVNKDMRKKVSIVSFIIAQHTVYFLETEIKYYLIFAPKRLRLLSICFFFFFRDR